MAQYERDLIERLRGDANSTVQDRLRAIIDSETSATRRWKELEDMSAISRHSWQKTYLGDQRPTVQMMEAVSQMWPQYTFWLMTGITDVAGGHICPVGQDPWPATPDELLAEQTEEPWTYLIRLKNELRKQYPEVSASVTSQPFDARAFIEAAGPKVNKMVEQAALAWLRYKASVKHKAATYQKRYEQVVKSNEPS